MQKTIKSLLERSSVYLAVVCTIVIAILSFVNLSNLPKLGFNHVDKFQHLLAYATLSFFWCLAHQFQQWNVKKSILLCAVVVYGLIIEVLQTCITIHRVGDIYDIIANTLGCLIGYVFFRLLTRIYLQV